MSMAAWCPQLCRPSCGKSITLVCTIPDCAVEWFLTYNVLSVNLGGRCATPSRCPKGFNVNKSGRVLPYSGKMTAPTYPFWPRNWGQQCYKYPNKGAPGYQNPSVSSNNRNSGGGNCAAMNHVCNSKPCCGGLKCGMMLRDKNRYCGP